MARVYTYSFEDTSLTISLYSSTFFRVLISTIGLRSLLHSWKRHLQISLHWLPWTLRTSLLVTITTVLVFLTRGELITASSLRLRTELGI